MALDDDLTEAALAPHITPAVPPPPEEVKTLPGTGKETLAERLARGKPTEQVIAETKGGPKRRGRPPGSKNKSTLEREAREREATGQVRMATPPKPGAKPGEDLTAQQRVEAKGARAAVLADKVADTINDNLMLVLMSMGCPVELLYKPGMEPIKVKASSNKYTELASQITMGPMEAGIIGRFLAEAEATDVGGKVGTAVADGKTPLIIYGILSAGVMIQWGRALTTAYKQFEPMLTAYKAAKVEAEQAQQQYANSQPHGGS